MNNFEENKKIGMFIVNLVSKMYHVGDGVLVEFHSASEFPFPEVTAMVSRDYRLKFNIDRLKVCPDYEVYITTFHEMRHIYQFCCIDFRRKLRYRKLFDEPKERVDLWNKEINNYYVSTVEGDMNYLGQDCEIDAMAFAYVMMKKLYDADVVVPAPVKELVVARAEEIKNKIGLNK